MSHQLKLVSGALVPTPLVRSCVHLSVSPPLGTAICLVTSTSRTAGSKMSGLVLVRMGVTTFNLLIDQTTKQRPQL